ELSTHEVKLAENRQRAQFLAEEVTREFQIEIATIDWKQELWHADDEPPGMKPLDLDEEDEEAEDREPGVEGQAASAESAPKRRRKKKEARGEATEDDLKALDAT